MRTGLYLLQIFLSDCYAETESDSISDSNADSDKDSDANTDSEHCNANPDNGTEYCNADKHADSLR